MYNEKNKCEIEYDSCKIKIEAYLALFINM